MNVKKEEVMVFNSIDPCQEFVFKGDIIKRVQTFKYLGILLETISHLDSAVEHLIVASRRSLLALNRHCAELRIMDIKLRCDFFNTIVCSIAMPVKFGWIPRK
jgi:hypothetical protein